MAGLYIHIPYCKSRCAYCDFVSQTRCQPGAPYVQALLNEFDRRRSQVEGDFDTIYIGGGTPSALAPEVLQLLVDGLAAHIDFMQVQELTIEVNPDDVTASTFALPACPVPWRVSMGVQTMCDDELRAVGRRHTAAQVVQAVEKLRRMRVDNLSLDLIYALPGQTMHSLQQTVDALLDLRPQHISAYALSVEEGTPLARSGFVPADDETYRQMYEYVCTRLAQAGFEHYEISNFALGHANRARHNQAYWRAVPYLGLGPGAHSFISNGQRLYNQGTVQTEGQGDTQGWKTVAEDETAVDRANDLLFAGLRMSDGLNINTLRPYVDTVTYNALAAQLQRYATRHHDSLTYDAARGIARIPRDQWFVADGIIRDLLL